MNSEKALTLAVILIGTLLRTGSLSAAETPRAALLVVIKDENALAIVDPVAKKVVGSVPAGDDPHEVEASSDGRFAFVSNFAPFRVADKPGRTISIINLESQKQVRQLDIGPLSMPHGLLFADGKLYFTAQGFKLIGRYDPASGKIDWMLGTSQLGTHMLVMTKDRNTIFTANGGSDTISAFERTTGLPPWRETVIAVGKAPQPIDISPDGREVWTGHGRDGGVSIIDVASKKVIQTLDLQTKQSNRLKFTLDGKWVLITDMGGNALVVVDAANRKEVKRINIGRSPEGILIAPDDQGAYVAVAGDNNVAILNLRTLEVTERIATGPNPDGLAWAERR